MNKYGVGLFVAFKKLFVWSEKFFTKNITVYTDDIIFCLNKEKIILLTEHPSKYCPAFFAFLISKLSIKDSNSGTLAKKYTNNYTSVF